MPNALWIILRSLQEDLHGAGRFPAPEHVDAALSAIFEGLPPILGSASKTQIEAGLTAARETLDVMTAENPINETSADYLAGRLAAIVDLLGYAVQQSVSDETIAAAKEGEIRNLMMALRRGGLCLDDVPTKTGKSREAVTRHLREMESQNLIFRQRRGKDVWIILTPAARSILEAAGLE